MLVTVGTLDDAAVVLSTRPPSLRPTLLELTTPVWLARKTLETTLSVVLLLEIVLRLLGCWLLLMTSELVLLGCWLLVTTLLELALKTSELMLLGWTRLLLGWTLLVTTSELLLLGWTMLLPMSPVELATTTLLDWLVLKLPAGLATTRLELSWELELLDLESPKR